MEGSTIKIKIGFLLSIMFVVLVGCSNEPTAKDRMNEYVSKWNKENFSSMYAQLSNDAKKSVSKKTFVDRYNNIYEQVGTTNLKVTVGKQSEKDSDNKKTQHIPYKVTMDTKAGKVSFNGRATLVNEKSNDHEDWKINWNPSFIFSQLKKGQTIQVLTTDAVRGNILDRNGNALAITESVPEIGIVPGQLGKGKDKVLDQTAKKLDMSRDEIDKQLSASWVTDDSFVPIKKVKPDQMDLVKKLTSQKGISKRDVDSRFYPYGEAAAHVTGYIRPITAEDLKKPENKNYSSTDSIGVAGLENVYENQLRGQTGWTILVRETKTVIAKKDVKNGKDVKTTIDINLQKKIYNQLKGDSGASVALNPKTGEALALVSSPSYDPNGFVFGWNDKTWKKLNDDPNRPFSAKFNKIYAPGSTIKPITAAIGLENGSITVDGKKKISGKEWQKDKSWGNYSVTRVSSRLSEVDLNNALITSDNIYFAQTALDTGANKFIQGLKQFGFAEKVPFEFPTQESSISNDGKIDSDILLADSGYGQGQIEMSPLHLAVSYTPLINNGNLVKPKLIKDDETTPSFWHRQVMSQSEADAITKGLKGVIESPNGSAHDPVVKGITVAGKTGTAELKKSKEDKKGTENGWFVGFDYKNQNLLISMMIQDVKDRHGSHYVAGKAKPLFKK